MICTLGDFKMKKVSTIQLCRSEIIVYDWYTYIRQISDQTIGHRLTPINFKINVLNMAQLPLFYDIQNRSCNIFLRSIFSREWASEVENFS